MKRKNKIDPSGLVIDVILKLTDKELLFLMISSPQSIYDLCLMATLENQTLEEEKS
jgi:hypothetical protein